MKKIFFLVMAVIVIIDASYSVFAQDNEPTAEITAYYFHGSFRCLTCTNMEKYSREAIETNFNDAVAAGKIKFKAVNVEEKGNEHFVNDYQLYTKSLILSLVKEGKEVKSKNLDKIWQLARNKKEFIDYVTDEVNEFRKDTQ